jgi:hypothetical protein
MIIIYNKANTLSLPYVDEAGAVKYVKFVPGEQEVEKKVWDAILEYNGSRFDHYGRFLKPLDEKAAGDGEIDYAALSPSKLSELIENTYDVEKLIAIETAENGREKGGRKSVLKQIDKQIELIGKEEAKLEESRN